MKLPPLNALRVFDAAARHLSFTRAADELAVTPAAVGQQIRALEDVLGVVLFRRTSKGLELTPEGEAGLDPLREGFLRFEESVAAMQAGQRAGAHTTHQVGHRHHHAAVQSAGRVAHMRVDAKAHDELVASFFPRFAVCNLWCWRKA